MQNGSTAAVQQSLCSSSRSRARAPPNRRRSTVNSQANYEKSVWNKTSRTNARGEGARVSVCARARCAALRCELRGCVCAKHAASSSSG